MKNLKRFKDSYDVIVVGSGNGGMGAALASAHAGMDTLLLEKHNLIGGFATSYVRGRYEFEATLHELCEYGDGELDKSLGYNTPKTRLRHLYEDEYGVDWEPVIVPDIFHIIDRSLDLDFTLPIGEKNVIKAISELAPEDSEKIKEYLQLCREITEACVELEENPDQNPLAIVTKHTAFVRMTGYNIKEVHEKFNFSPKVKAVMDVLTTYIGVCADDVAFVLYAFMLHMFIAQGPMIPRHTSHQMATKAELALRRMGAQVECCCFVKRLISDGKKVCGVVLEDGTEIRAKYVICNASPTIAVSSMIPDELIPERMKKLYNVRKTTCNTFTMALGLDATPEELGIKHYECFAGKMDLVAYEKAVHKMESVPFVCGTCPDIAIPGHSGEGRCQLSFTIIHYDECMDHYTPEDYAKNNEALAQRVIDMFERDTGVTIRDHIEEMVLATPATFSNLCNSFRGSIYGYTPNARDGIIIRTLSRDKDRMVPGLLFCGTGEFRCAGYDCSMMSGIMAGEYVAKQLKEGK